MDHQGDKILVNLLKRCTNLISSDFSNKFPTVTAMKALPAQSILVTATAEGTLRMLDTRSPLAYQHELKVRYDRLSCLNKLRN